MVSRHRATVRHGLTPQILFKSTRTTEIKFIALDNAALLQFSTAHVFYLPEIHLNIRPIFLCTPKSPNWFTSMTFYSLYYILLPHKIVLRLLRRHSIRKVGVR
jgi:hypothetical protein